MSNYVEPGLMESARVSTFFVDFDKIASVSSDKSKTQGDRRTISLTTEFIQLSEIQCINIE